MVLRFSKQFVVRVSEDLKNLVRSVAVARGEDLSDFIRRAILKELASLSFLSDDQKKALGFKEYPRKHPPQPQSLRVMHGKKKFGGEKQR